MRMGQACSMLASILTTTSNPASRGPVRGNDGVRHFERWVSCQDGSLAELKVSKPCGRVASCAIMHKKWWYVLRKSDFRTTVTYDV